VSPQARGEKHGRTQVKVKMTDLTKDSEWIWDKEKFINRKFIMQEQYQTFLEEEHIPDVGRENDPFWEPDDSEVAIGSVHVYLTSLAYLIEVEESLAITDYKGNSCGHLAVHLVPCSAKGQLLDDDDFVEDPSELIGQSLHFKMGIQYARGLPSKFSKGETFCKYKVYMDESFSTTSSIKSTINPEYKHEKLFSFPSVTKQLVEYLSSTPLVVDVWGVQGTALKKGVEGKSTKELMSIERNKNNSRGMNSKGVPASVSEEIYKMQVEMNTFKRRMEMKERKLQRVMKVIQEHKQQGKTDISIPEIEKVFNSSDSKRLKAAAKLIADGERRKANTSGSQACVLQ